MTIYHYTLHVADPGIAEKVKDLFQDSPPAGPVWGPKWIGGKMAPGLVVHWTDAAMEDGQLESRPAEFNIKRLSANPFVFEL